MSNIEWKVGDLARRFQATQDSCMRVGEQGAVTQVYPEDPEYPVAIEPFYRPHRDDLERVEVQP